MKPEELDLAVSHALDYDLTLTEVIPPGTPDRDKRLAKARASLAARVAFLLSDPSEKTDTERLQAIGESFDSLPEADRMFNGQVLSWNQVLAAIPNREEFLEGIKSLSKPTAYWINEQGELVIGDGHAGIRSENKGEAYDAAEKRAEAVPNRGLITEEEYKRIVAMLLDANFERGPSVKGGIWLGRSPSKAEQAKPQIVHWFYGQLSVTSMADKADHSQIGVRYVVRTPLKPQTP